MLRTNATSSRGFLKSEDRGFRPKCEDQAAKKRRIWKMKMWGK